MAPLSKACQSPSFGLSVASLFAGRISAIDDGRFDRNGCSHTSAPKGSEALSLCDRGAEPIVEVFNVQAGSGEIASGCRKSRSVAVSTFATLLPPTRCFMCCSNS